MNNILSYLSGLHADVMTPKQRSTHIHIAGKPGTGKSRMIESMVIQDVNAGHGVGFIDPHGDLFRNLLFRLATKEEVWDRVVIIDPLDPEWTIGFNPLAKNYNLTEERQALYLTDVGMKIWGISPTSAPRMVWLMSNSFLALSSLGLTLLDLPRFLMDVEYRERLVPRIGNQQAKQFFMHEFPKSERAIHQWVTPVLNKIGGLIFDPELRLIFSSPTTLNMRRVIDEQLILLVNLPKGILGEGASALTAAFIVALLQKAALSRTDVHVRKPFYLYLDEFQNYTTDNIKDILAESRKYALSLILAHQYLDQLSSDLQSAVLNTSGTLISFQVGYHDALKLAKEIFPSPDFNSQVSTSIGLRRQGYSFLPHFRNVKDAPGWDGIARLLTQLRPREFWCRYRGTIKPVKQRAFYMPDPDFSEEQVSQVRSLRARSGQRYGIRKEIAAARVDNSNTYPPPGSDVGGVDFDNPFWSD
jgi:hypothetical protein